MGQGAGSLNHLLFTGRSQVRQEVGTVRVSGCAAGSWVPARREPGPPRSRRPPGPEIGSVRPLKLSKLRHRAPGSACRLTSRQSSYCPLASPTRVVRYCVLCVHFLGHMIQWYYNGLYKARWWNTQRGERILTKCRRISPRNVCVCISEPRLMARSAPSRIARVLCTQARRTRGGPPLLLFLPPCRNPGKMT